MQNILTCSNGLTRVVSHGLMLDADQRPELPFAFDALYYEPPTGLAFRVLAEKRVPLTDAEAAACEAYCESFLDTADYPVFALDESGVFAGHMLKSAAKAKGLAYRIAEAPDHPASKWNGTAWQRIAAAILDDGTLHLLPEAVCDQCTLVFSSAEWAVFPQPPEAEDGALFKWDFKAAVWRDVSDPFVYAYDEVGAFVGQYRRSALREGWGYTRDAPETQASIMTSEGWRPVAAGINEDGRVDIRPGGIRDEVILLFTREEWARWPQRPASDQGEFWVWDFVAEEWRDGSNFYGGAFELDGDRASVFAGHMPRLEAEKEGLGWTRQMPESAAAKWDGTAWQPVVVVIMDDGTPRLNPSAVCDLCMLALTAEEWAAWPKMPHEMPEALGTWRWNFAQGRWEDRRDAEKLRKQVRREVVMFDLWGTWTEIRDNYELHLAAQEAKATGTPTPFLDAYASESGKSRADVAMDFAERFMRSAADMGAAAARRAALLDSIEAATDNAALDAIFGASKAAFENALPGRA